MNWWQVFTGTQPKLPAHTVMKLRVSRFHRILENQKRFNDLISDAMEKLGGEYVLDKQYIASLVEEVFGLASEIICDSNLICESTGSCKQYYELEKLKTHLRRILAWQPMSGSGELIIPAEDIDELDHYHLVGGAFTRLAEVRQRLGLRVPEGFVISVAAFNMFVEYNNLSHLLDLSESLNHSSLLELEEQIRHARAPGGLWNGIEAELARMSETYGPDLRLVVSGSVFGDEYNRTAEDGVRRILNVDAAGVFKAYKSILAELYSAAAVRNRIEFGLVPRCSIAVSVARMISSDSGGTVETVNPEKPQRDRMRISIRANSKSATLDVSRHAPYDVRAFSLSDAAPDKKEIADLAEQAMRMERYFRGPQEITWTRDDMGRIFIIRTVPLMLDPEKVIEPGNLAEAVANHEVIYEREGKIASSGISSGEVYVAREEADIRNMPERCVLVADNLDPGMGLLDALGRAAAIITDRGETAGHMASLAREFHVPAIVGMGDATQRFTPGEKITVDADDNMVYRGVVDELLNYHLWEYLDLDMSREYRLLRFVLHRLTARNLAGSRSRRTRLKYRETLEHTVRTAVDLASGSISEAAWAARPLPGRALVSINNKIGLKLQLLDIGAGRLAAGAGGEVAGYPVSFAPFWEELSGSEIGKFAPGAYCFAAVSGERMLMLLNSGVRSYILGVHMCDDPERNYIYGRVSESSRAGAGQMKRTLWLREILGRYTFETYAMNDGLTACKYNLTRMEMEQAMRMLGGMLGYAESPGEARDSDTVDGEIEKFLEQHGDRVRTQ